MARSQETFNKKEVRNKKEKKRKEKAQKKLDKKDGKKNSLDDMIAYVDEKGRIVDTPPEPNKKSDIKAEDIQIGVPRTEDVEIDPIRSGVVAFFNNDKGFGFIKDLETKESVFVHINNTLESINEGNLVTFEMGNGPKGPTAIQVKLKK